MPKQECQSTNGKAQPEVTKYIHYKIKAAE